MPAIIENHLALLEGFEAERVAHHNGTLLKHLKGVWALLREWKNPDTVCLAGLYHSVYGTGNFEQQLVPLSERNKLAELIGEEAERFVYLFGACDRPLTCPRIGVDEPLEFHDRITGTDYPLENSEWCALCEIMLANNLDIGHFDPTFYKKHLPRFKDQFTRFEPWLSKSAIKARHDFEQQYNLGEAGR